MLTVSAFSSHNRRNKELKFIVYFPFPSDCSCELPTDHSETGLVVFGSDLQNRYKKEDLSFSNVCVRSDNPSVKLSAINFPR